ncbi:hypothetical protein HG536_0E00700 [Torulaspora globosa]|uniref:Uncharacterized protein n=1 Tax=Torulaspora globosa TaxID=48254 RepID=A0A7G3ZI24_9SACH|nr:uncharacterized protein HG536_0E00700 [Torulaspora globosa]QLL33160.1 hypothetical protein HG536_0E00700 [Torulaspora globosa]
MSINTKRLGTLKEEESAGGSLTSHMLNHVSQDCEHNAKQETLKGGRIGSPYVSGANGGSALPKSRCASISSNSVSTNSKTVGLGIARRPSDNLLLNMTALEDDIKKLDEEAVALSTNFGLPPPRKNFAAKAEKNDRPISNDSIATRTTELFSSATSDVNSGSSSVENENDTESKECRDELNDSRSSTDNESDSETCSVENLSLSTHCNETIRSGTKGHPDAVQRTRYFFNNGSKATSQISLAGSTSTITSPVETANDGALQRHSLPAASPLYFQVNSTSAILPSKGRLTPSQRYRLRKAQNETALRKSIRRKEKFYEEQDRSSELRDDLENILIWNIPVASTSTNSFLTSSKENRRSRNMPSDSSLSRTKNSDDHFAAHRLPYLDYHEMPTSPIPGVNNTTDFQYMQQATQNLSSVYLHSSDRLSQSKLCERTASADFLPIEFKAASDLGLEDLKLVSEDKLEVTSHSRPSWLPPKDPQERKLHEEQISKSTSMASIEQLDRNKESQEKAIRDETNRQKYVLLLARDITRNSSLRDLKKLIWETAFSDETRNQAYNDVLQSNARTITGEFLEPFEDMMRLLNEMDFPKGKEAEIEQLIKVGVRCKIAGKDGVPKELALMLKLKSISQQGLQCGDELLFHHFLSSKSFSSLEQVWDAVNLVQMTCFNDHCKEKFNSRILNSRGIVAHYLLRGDDFKDEFNASCLNSSTWWNLMERVDHALFMWIIDIIVVANSQCFKKVPVSKQNTKDKGWEDYRAKHVVVNYKILLSLVLNVLLNYHFGFNDLKSLSSLDDSNFCIPMPMDHLLDTDSVNQIFVRKWLHYFKKF